MLHNVSFAEVNASDIATDYIIAHTWHSGNSVSILELSHISCLCACSWHLVVSGCCVLLSLLIC